jgi:putative PIG3 family NAD(P)H quinone oxidoreductase
MPLPARMTAIAIKTPGGPEVLAPEERDVPTPGASEILVKVAAAGVNRPDVMQRKGQYPPPPGAPDIPGLEIAGEIAAVGSQVQRWKVGDRVTALVAGGGYAQYCLADEAVALPVPKGLSMIEAAALPETFMTVWHNVFQRGALKAGEAILVHGGSSGIGTTAIMLAKAFGAKVIVTAGSAQKCAACKKLGADFAIDYKTEDFVVATKAATGGRGADLILDMVGGDYVERNYDAAAVEGRIVQIATQQGFKVSVNLLKIMQKRLTHTGSTLRPRPVADKAMISRDLEEKAWPLLAAGKIKPVIDSTFPLQEAAKAHARMESSAHVGKIVLEVGA